MIDDNLKKILIDYTDSLRCYIAESGADIANDERESSEFVEIFITNYKGGVL